MKKIFGFTKKKRSSSSTPDNGSVLSVGYELKDKDLGKVHKAASVGDLAKLKQLAKKNDINQLDKENRTALHIACANGHVELAQFLVESKAKLDLCDNQNRSALMKAVQCQHERCVSILLENHANPNLVDINGNTALHLAANIPSVSTAVLLLQYDAEINSQNKEGFTPLTVAVREDHIEMADFLLKEAAKVNLTDQNQRSPLMIAAGNGQIRMVRLLLQFDADIMLKDASGYSADDYAVMNGHHPCSHLIIEHGTRRTDRASLSNQGQCKKKKVTGTSSQDIEAGFSLGGPAADKDEHEANEAERDYEEDSQSQSLSRVSKSAADEWLSSDDDDESVLVEKKQLKVNLSKMISRKAEAAALHDNSESEQESETRVLRIPSQAKHSPSFKLLPVDPSPDPLPSKEPQMASIPLPLCTQHTGLELPSSSKTRSGSQEESSSADDSEEEEEDEEEEEEEEEEDEEDEEEEEEEDDDSNEEEEDDDDSEEEDREEIEEGKGSLEDENDGMATVLISTPESAQPDKCAQAEPPNNNLLILASAPASFTLPATLNIQEDYVVSAIRVESKFSDDDESLGRETPRKCGETSIPSKLQEEYEGEMDNEGLPLSFKHDGELEWNDCDEEPDWTRPSGCSALLANQAALFSNIVAEKTDSLSNDGSQIKCITGEKHRSSWGSSLDESDGDSAKEGEHNNDPKCKDKETDFLAEATVLHPKSSSPLKTEAHSDSPWDSPLPGASKPCSRSSAKLPTNMDESDWDSSENQNQIKMSSSIKCNAESIISKKNPPTEKESVEQQTYTKKQLNVELPVGSPETENKETVRQTSEMHRALDSDNEEDNNSWDDIDQSDDSEKPGVTDHSVPVTLQSTLSRLQMPTSPIENHIKEKAAGSDAEDNENQPGEETQRALGRDQSDDDDDEASEDSDSKDQRLHYDFVSASVTTPHVVDDQSDAEHRAKLTGYFQLDSEKATFSPPRALSDEYEKEPKIFPSPPTKHGPHSDSIINTGSDEALPQTDIDDVNLDSHDETDVEKNNSSQDENEDDDEEEEEEEEEDEDDLTDEDDQPVETDGALEACSPAADAEVSTDKRRDFRSELGLDKHEDEQDSWDSEVPSEELPLPPKEHPRLVTRDEEKATVGDEIKENGASSEDPIRADSVECGQCEDSLREKEAEKTKWQALNVLSKLQEDGEQKSEEFMEELGLGDADDLEDASDWDSASTTSRRTLPGRRMTSPGHEDFLEGSGGPVKEQDKEYTPAALLTPQQCISPVPVPRTRKVGPQKEEEPDWDKVASTKASPNDDQTHNVAESPKGSPEIHLNAKHSTSSSEDDQLKKKRKDDAVDRSGLEVNASGPVGCEGHGKKDLQGQCPAEENKDKDKLDEVQWEKHYEKLWVEVEKREMKSTFRNVAGELKEKFRQLPTSRALPKNILEEVTAGSTSAEEESSDEDDEVIVRPIARARSTVLLSIPEQRESGLEDSESSENSFSEDRIQDSKQPAHRAASLITDSAKDLNKIALDSDLVGSTVSSSEAEKSNLNPVDHDTQQSSLHALRRQSSPPVSRLSDEELEEDMEKFKHEPDERTPNTTVKILQTSNTEGVDGLKSEIKSGCPVGEEVHQQQQPMAANSAAVSLLQLHLPVQQNISNTKQEKEAVKKTLQLQRLRAPLTSTHVNGDPFPVFDDSTLSDVSDDEGRLPARERHKMKKTEEVDLAEDFDELTQSSDTATDDIDSPTSGYRHASVLIQKLDLPDLEPRSKVKLQNIFYEYERSNQKTRSRWEYEANKVRQLESEKAELKNSLENIHDVKSALERNQLELQTEVTNLKFHLKQEQENRRNATMMYNTSQDKLRRMEEQHQLEVQERQNVELTLRNHELEMRTLLNNMKQLEEDHIETQRQLAQERSTRALQESLLNNHLRRQQDIEEENQKNMSKSSEALSQLTEATDRERELVQHSNTLQELLTTVRAELQGCLTSSSLKESHLTEEKEALKEQLEDSRRDLKLSNEALSQTVFTCDQQMTQLKTELAMATMRLETERQTCQTMEAKVESTQTCLTGALKEVELCIAARADMEKSLHREKEEHQRLKDRFTDEMASQREAVTLLSQKLSKAEAHANSLENEVHRASLQLTEKGVLLDVLQREKDQASARLKETETALRAEAELVSRARASQEATQERLAQTQSEGMLLRQQLEESQNKGSAKERAVTDAQELFGDLLSKVRSDCEERVQLVEDRNKELVTKVADQRNHIYKLEEEKNERGASLRQLQQELADSLKRMSMSEASLEVNTRYRNDLEEEKARLLKDIERLKAKLEDWEDQYVQAEKHIAGLKSSVDQKEKEVGTATQKLQEALSASASSHVTIKQLEEAIQRLEIDNARLEAAAKQQSTKIESLQKEVQEATMVRGHLEELVTNLQSSKMTLEDQLDREVQKQSMLSHTAQDSQALWEEELKSRSKLGLRLAELEKEKGELNSQMELEKKKAKKIAEQKKAVDTRLDQEMKRNAELQKEMYRLRTLLKTAKKKLRDQDGAGAEFVSPLSSLRLEQGRHSHADGTFGRMQATLQVEDLSVQLEKEASRRSQLERLNEELKDQMASMTGRNHSNEQLERSRKQLEEEVLDLRRRAELAKVEHDQMEHYRRDAEEKARQEVQQKLEQVNLFLQTQAASQEALDRIKSANEVNLRSQLEQRIRELEEELSRAHSSQQDSLHQRESTRTELQRCHTLYTNELRVRKSLEAKLERANARLAEANSKLLGERSRFLISSSMANSSIRGSVMPSNHSLGLSFLTPPQGPSSNTDDYLTKMQRELDRSISKELSSAKAELDVASARLSPVGSASRAEADPVSRATQQYLEVLKKNYMI